MELNLFPSETARKASMAAIAIATGFYDYFDRITYDKSKDEWRYDSLEMEQTIIFSNEELAKLFDNEMSEIKNDLEEEYIDWITTEK